MTVLFAACKHARPGAGVKEDERAPAPADAPAAEAPPEAPPETEDQTETGPNRPFAPEDLAVLLPITGGVFDKPFKDDNALRARLGQDLIPLGRVMSNAFYQQVVAATLAQPAGDFNPLAGKPTFSEGLRATPLGDWFVSGLHFIPCASDHLHAPASWLKAKDNGALHALACRPRIRLSIQRFAAMHCSGCNDAATGDDKAFHLVLNYLGTLSDNELKPLAAADAAADAFFVAHGKDGTVDAGACARKIQELYGVPALQATLKKLRQAFLATLNGLRPAAAGNLRVPYGGKDALPRYRNYVETQLGNQSAPLTLTQSLVTSGLEPGLADTWFFARYKLANTRNALMAGNVAPLPRETLGFAYADGGGKLKTVFAGSFEQFTDLPGSATAIDPSLRDNLESLPPAEIDAPFATMGMQIFAKHKGGQPVLDDLSIPEPLKARPAPPEFQAGYDAVHNPKTHDAVGSTCVGCHVTTMVRMQTGLRAVPKAVTNGNMVVDQVGPSKNFLNQTEFRPTWFIRALGYYGRAPSIADRLVAEVDADLEDAARIAK